jgi:hypothetical protein
MKKGYWVVVYRSISDESAVKAYGALASRRLSHSAGAL